MNSRICTICNVTFESNKEQVEGLMCYDCALARITHGLSPEEGDFNTAKILSGTLTQEEEGWLKEDLQAVEGGSSSRKDYYDDDDTYYEDDKYYDDLYPEYCEKCGSPEEYCQCYES